MYLVIVKNLNSLGEKFILDICYHFHLVASWLIKYKEDPEFKKFKGDSVSFECPAKGNPLKVEWKVKKKGEDRGPALEVTDAMAVHDIFFFCPTKSK